MADEFEVNYVDEEIGDVGEEIVVEEVTNARGKKRVFEPGDVGRRSKQSSKKYNTKKRKFYGNQQWYKKSKKSVICIIEKSKSSQKTFSSEEDGRI